MIEASAPEEKATTAMMMEAWVAGSVLISKTSFMEEDGNGRKKGLEGECWKNARVRGRQPGKIRTTAFTTATESPWCLVKGENLMVREVSSSFLLLLALLEDQGQTNSIVHTGSFLVS